MTISKFTLATLMTGLFATAATAQAVPFSQIDTDADGILTYEELTVAFGSDGASTVLGNADADGNNSLTEAEIRSGGDARRDAGQPDTSATSATTANGSTNSTTPADTSASNTTTDDLRAAGDARRDAGLPDDGHQPAGDANNASSDNTAGQDRPRPPRGPRPQDNGSDTTTATE